MPVRTFNRVLRPHLDADLHRGTVAAIDPGFEDEQVADVNRGDEVNVVHRSGDDVRSRVTVRRRSPRSAKAAHCRDQVNKVHEPATQKIAEGVRVIGQHQLGHLGLRDAGASRRLRLGVSRRSLRCCHDVLS